MELRRNPSHAKCNKCKQYPRAQIWLRQTNRQLQFSSAFGASTGGLAAAGFIVAERAIHITLAQEGAKLVALDDMRLVGSILLACVHQIHYLDMARRRKTGLPLRRCPQVL